MRHLRTATSAQLSFPTVTEARSAGVNPAFNRIRPRMFWFPNSTKREGRYPSDNFMTSPESSLSRVRAGTHLGISPAPGRRVERAWRNIGCVINEHCQIYHLCDASRRVSVRLRPAARRVARLCAITAANDEESFVDRDRDRDHDAAQSLHSTHL